MSKSKLPQIIPKLSTLPPNTEKISLQQFSRQFTHCEYYANSLMNIHQPRTMINAKNCDEKKYFRVWILLFLFFFVSCSRGFVEKGGNSQYFKQRVARGGEINGTQHIFKISPETLRWISRQ